MKLSDLETFVKTIDRSNLVGKQFAESFEKFLCGKTKTLDEAFAIPLVNRNVRLRKQRDFWLLEAARHVYVGSDRDTPGMRAKELLKWIKSFERSRYHNSPTAPEGLSKRKQPIYSALWKAKQYWPLLQSRRALRDLIKRNERVAGAVPSPATN